jgi:hypothetical protein
VGASFFDLFFSQPMLPPVCVCVCMKRKTDRNKDIRCEKFIGWHDSLDGANFCVTRRCSRPHRTTTFQRSVHSALLRESKVLNTAKPKNESSRCSI